MQTKKIKLTLLNRWRDQIAADGLDVLTGKHNDHEKKMISQAIKYGVRECFQTLKLHGLVQIDYNP